MAALIISNEEMEDAMKIVKSLKELIKGVRETIKNEAKEQKDGFLPMFFGKLATSILENTLAGWGVVRAGQNF